MDPLSSWALIVTLLATTCWGVRAYTRWANARHRPPRVHDATLRAIRYAEDRGREEPRAQRILE